MKKRKAAQTTGWSLLLMALVAGLSIGFAYTQFDTPDQFELLKENILQSIVLYRGMIIGILMIIILDFIVSYTLYIYFKDDHKKMSIASGIIRAVYTIIFGIATYFLLINLDTENLTNEIAYHNFQRFQTIWISGLVLFGFHIILIGFLMRLHLEIPKVLWIITLIAGIAYVLVSSLKLQSPDSDMVNTVEMVLALPMTVGEMGLAIWLILRGGKVIV